MSLIAQLVFILAAAIAAAACLAVFGRSLPRGSEAFERALRPPRRTASRPTQLVALERIVANAGWSAIDVHAYLRPVLAEIAAMRLARRGLRLEPGSSEARRVLGPAVWELVRPDRPFPDDRLGRGLGPRELAAIVAALEAP